jgi:hypothetical protein
MSESYQDYDEGMRTLEAAAAYRDPNITAYQTEIADVAPEPEYPPNLVGFPPGFTKDDYFAVNGGQPPFGNWVWPDDFGDADKALFWSYSSRSDGGTREEMAAYNRVAAFNRGDQVIGKDDDVDHQLLAYSYDTSLDDELNQETDGSM